MYNKRMAKTQTNENNSFDWEAYLSDETEHRINRKEWEETRLENMLEYGDCEIMNPLGVTKDNFGKILYDICVEKGIF